MIIGIDGNEANVEAQVGVSVYTLELLKRFAKKADQDTQFVVFLRKHPIDSMPKASKYYRYEVVSGTFLWSQIFLPYHLMVKSTIDVFFSPAHYAPRFLNVPLVLTIHDLSFFYYPQEFLKKDLYKLKNWTEYSIKKAARIIAVSKTTKKDVMKWYAPKEDTVQVIYNGFRKRTRTADSSEVLEKYGLSTHKYLLYVGTLQPRKNIQTLIAAFDVFQKNHAEFKLVLVGKKGWMFDQIFEEVQKRNLEDKVVFTGYAPDEELVALYEEAFTFVLPSLYEGFGIPILEAMSHGCPVISSHASSLPEIGADACLYFDPIDAVDLVEKLELLIGEKSMATTLVKAGRERVKEFSWTTCADETLACIKQTISSL
ncbi:glycosyltransferase family 4 protein [Candidatus Woesebacteria bacterium]|nr:glycosyltransferase family 4 protein [Candidatus Woesebacteria bacterium]